MELTDKQYELVMEEIQQMVDQLQKLIDSDKTILQNPEFIDMMNKFGFKYDGIGVTLFSVKSKTK
tara:strand:- start:712 stop:906 length:195 start_codon:yes stop_codon:yes gene_type:complete